jgi:hypothetical protein
MFLYVYNNFHFLLNKLYPERTSYTRRNLTRNGGCNKLHKHVHDMTLRWIWTCRTCKRVLKHKNKINFTGSAANKYGNTELYITIRSIRCSNAHYVISPTKQATSSNPGEPMHSSFPYYVTVWKVRSSLCNWAYYEKPYLLCGKRRDSPVGIVTGYGLDDRGIAVRVSVRSSMSTSSYCRDRLWGQASLLSNEYFPRGKAAGAWSWPLSN